MRPDPDPKATMATISDSMSPDARTARTVRDRGGAARAGAGVMAGRILVGIIGAMVGVLCGITAAVLATTSVIAGELPNNGESVALAALTVPSLGGRWSGTPYAVRNDPSRCDGDDCKLVLDIVPCAVGWCGIEVDKANVCADTLMQLSGHKDQQRRNAFEGKLSLGKDTQGYIIEAQLEPAEDGRPAYLEIVGDTGPEFRIFRRSFPFHTALTRVGDATCKASEKPVS
jgi:hypothetical protein